MLISESNPMDIQSIHLQDIQKYFSFRRVTLFWYRHFKLMFILLFLNMLGFAAYLWYNSVYNYEWDDTQKKAYTERTFTETNLKEKEFQKLLESLKQRKSEYENPLDISKNLFTGEPLVKN